MIGRSGNSLRDARVPLEQALLLRAPVVRGDDERRRGAEALRPRRSARASRPSARCRCRGGTGRARRSPRRAARMTAMRSATVCEVGSPVEPPTEMPCVPCSSCQSTSARDRVEVERAVVRERRDERGDRAPDAGRVGGEAAHRALLLVAGARAASASYSARRSLRDRVDADGPTRPPGRARAPTPRAPPARARRGATSSASAAGSTSTPSASPTITSPGMTSTPPQAIGTFASSGMVRAGRGRPRAGPGSRSGSSSAATAGQSRSAAVGDDAGRRRARSTRAARMSPIVPAPGLAARLDDEHLLAARWTRRALLRVELPAVCASRTSSRSAHVAQRVGVAEEPQVGPRRAQAAEERVARCRAGGAGR